MELEPASAGVDLATSICSGAMSIASTPAGPILAAIHLETVPVPQPMSATRAASLIAAAFKPFTLTGP
jgi:hypothetical protein